MYTRTPVVLNHSPITISTPTASATAYIVTFWSMDKIVKYKSCILGVSSHIAMPSRMQ